MNLLANAREAMAWRLGLIEYLFETWEGTRSCTQGRVLFLSSALGPNRSLPPSKFLTSSQKTHKRVIRLHLQSGLLPNSRKNVGNLYDFAAGPLDSKSALMYRKTL